MTVLLSLTLLIVILMCYLVIKAHFIGIKQARYLVIIVVLTILTIVKHLPGWVFYLYPQLSMNYP